VIVLLLALAANDGDAGISVTKRPFPNSPIPEATVTAVVDAPPEIVWSLVSDCANYQRTMPNIADSVEVKRETLDDGTEVKTCRVVAALPFPFPNLTSLTRGVHRVEPGKSWSRTWSFVSGDYVKNEGGWKITPVDDGKRSRVEYTIEAQPKIALPDWLIADVEESKLPQLMKNLRAEAAAKLAQSPSTAR
jgi:ribosome-associated toxin RatA of RatAB toxin-antitoxin module